MSIADTIREFPVQVKLCPDCGHRFGIDAAFCPFDGVALSVATWDKAGDPLVGKRVDGRYEVLEPLGEGGMGSVYRVRHMTLERLFAMKVLRRDLADDVELAQRFVHEAKATAAVKHPGVVQITDFGALESGTPYFVMELLLGETLAMRIRARGPLLPPDAIRVARRIADALEASHAAGVVHRDLKPDNVFLVGRSLGRASEDEVRIVDFGAARVVGASRLTRPGVVFGTPYYMSPEQASGHAVDARADVYSLGVLLYEMVTGALPFEADTYMGVLTKHMFAVPAKPSERIASGIPLGALEDVILRALEKDPGARYASMAEMSAALAAAASRAGGPVQPVVSTTTEVLRGLERQMELGASKVERIQASLDQRLAEDARRRRTWLAVGIAMAAAAGAAVATGAGSFGGKQTGMPDQDHVVTTGGTTATASPAASAVPAAPTREVAPAPSGPAAPRLEEASAAPSSAVAAASPAHVKLAPVATAKPALRPSGTTSAPAPAQAPPPPPRTTVDPVGNDFPDPWKR